VFSDDGVSGAEFKNRPSLNALLSAVKETHRLDALIVSEQSRLGRDTIRTLPAVPQQKPSTNVPCRTDLKETR
jgi:DNA invertase Pin-like site-specific DNA recombinase